jgi:tRNA-Thr(GGU) m(6)t(6)A37 methyltransferase TsaA
MHACDHARLHGSERPGEVRAPIDPAGLPGDAKIVFIGWARTPWRSREECPKNVREALERGGGAVIEIDPAWRPGLQDVRSGDRIIVVTWLDRARRDLLIQAPRHRERPVGVFSLRSPVRPNPVGIHVVQVTACEAEAGRIGVDALDCLDGTPVIDLKPWFPEAARMRAADQS